MHLRHIGSRRKGDRKMLWENKRDNVLVFENAFTSGRTVRAKITNFLTVGSFD